jgi:type IV pilus assembly protein PilC
MGEIAITEMAGYSTMSRGITMAQFVFTFLDDNKKPISGMLEASDRESAMKTLADKYATVIELKEIKPRRGLFARKISGEELMVVTRQLATMLKAGVPIRRSLEIMVADSDNPTLQAVLADISKGISEGKAMSEVMKKYPDVFSRLYVYMVEAGETGGSLPTLLDKLATYITNAEEMRRKVKAALSYPVTVIVIACAISLFIFIFGVGQFKEIYAGMDAKLPAATTFLINVSDFLGRYWYIMLLLLLIATHFLRIYLRTERGQFARDQLILRLPLVGPIVQRSSIAQFSRTLSSLYEGGVSILKSLELVAGSMGNRVLENAVLKVLKDTKEGESIAGSLRESGVFTRMAISMISTGEESGSLGTMLDEIGNFYEMQVDVALKGMASMIEPIVMLVVGIFVGMLIFALGMPLFNLVQVLQ